MKLLFDHEVEDSPGSLDDAWNRDESFAFLPGGRSDVAEWIREASGRIPVSWQARHFGLLTSGSTGHPKLIIGSRSRAERLVKLLWQLQDSDPVETIVSLLPLTYSFAFVNQWLTARVFGRPLIRTAGFGVPELIRRSLNDAEASMLCLVGVHVPLLERYFANEVFPHVIRLHFAGGRFPQEKLPQLKSFFPNARIFNNYGCAEAMPRLTLRTAEQADAAANIGSPLPGVELRANEDSELLFRSPYRAVGFVEQSGVREINEAEWLLTGDLGYALDDGTWDLSGRAGEVFKRHGEKVAVAPLLAAVHRSWGQHAACYRTVDTSGEHGLVLVLSPNPSTAQVREILRTFRTGFPRAHWPIRIEGVDRIPLLPNGKIDQQAIISSDEKAILWYQRL